MENYCKLKVDFKGDHIRVEGSVDLGMLKSICERGMDFGFTHIGPNDDGKGFKIFKPKAERLMEDCKKSQDKKTLLSDQDCV